MIQMIGMIPRSKADSVVAALSAVSLLAAGAPASWRTRRQIYYLSSRLYALKVMMSPIISKTPSKTINTVALVFAEPRR